MGGITILEFLAGRKFEFSAEMRVTYWFIYPAPSSTMESHKPSKMEYKNGIPRRTS